MASPILQWLRTSPLGSGSFGHVSLAINLDIGQFFAVKSTPCSAPSDELHAIERELCILKSLDSPRIVRCLGGDYSSKNGSLYRNLFLEYMDGGSIADLVKKSGGRLDEGRARCYTRGIVEGLVYLHDQGIVHCDIKGQNILVGLSGVKIADFGAAKRLGLLEKEACKYKGTPLWMAPEVVQGVEQGHPSDIWSLGCTVVEMLQGRPPWANRGTSTTSVAGVLYKIGCSLEDPPLPEHVSEDAKDFLSKCLQRDPDSRWTAAQLLEHPFVQAAPNILTYSDQPSPRSVLDFLSVSTDEEEYHTRPLMACAERAEPSILPWHVETGNRCAVIMSPRSENGWVTVRCANGWWEGRQKPFFKRGHMREVVVVRKGEEVNMDSLAFLVVRRRPVG